MADSSKSLQLERKRITIVGVGLIGGSLALQLNEKGLAAGIIGVEANKDHAQKALDLHLVDEIKELKEAIKDSDVVVLAIPVDKLIHVLPAVLDLVEHQLVFDVGSTKQLLIEGIKDHPNRSRYIATHPMWGTEYSGPEAAVRGAFENKAVVICNAADSDPDVVEWVKGMYQKIAMHLLEMNAVDHDLHTAYVSHISTLPLLHWPILFLRKKGKKMPSSNWPARVLKVQCDWQRVIRQCGFPYLCRTRKMYWMF
jgi:prephenate dehydrogenase